MIPGLWYHWRLKKLFKSLMTCRIAGSKIPDDVVEALIERDGVFSLLLLWGDMVSRDGAFSLLLLWG
jgi:hypothetical protein